ncbi:MAG TPA: methyltransferase domain-containing protein [Steroidobacteraceae bacterium]
MRAAIEAHNAGRLAEAEVGYRRILRKRPNDPGALYGLGLLHFHQGAVGTALEHITQSLQVAPANARAWNTLGSMYRSLGRAADAKSAYEQATKAAPTMSEAWYNLAITQRKEGDIDSAVGSLYAATACASPYAQAFDALASLLYQEGREREAGEVYRLWAANAPHNAKARHLSAASTGDVAPHRASDDYVREHFDAAASSFDANLKTLHYRSHEAVASAVAELAKRSAAGSLEAVLDAGCGTGLCGPLLRPACRRLVGVDLSPKMIDQARARSAYDELVVGELSAFMRSRANTFDAIACADTLVYFGALEDPVSSAHACLRAAGTFVFTVEQSGDSHLADHRLAISGRYQHRETYVRRVLDDRGFQLESLSRTTLREERGQPVAGLLVVARRK